MSTHEQQQEEQQILDACMRINEALQIDAQQFSLESLTHLQWYITVLELIYPQLENEFKKIRTIQDEGRAFDQLLKMLASQQIIEEDFLEIKGSDIIQGDVESVYYVVQLLTALIQRQAEEDEDENQAQEQQQQQFSQSQSQRQQSQKNNKMQANTKQANHQRDESQQYPEDNSQQQQQGSMIQHTGGQEGNDQQEEEEENYEESFQPEEVSPEKSLTDKRDFYNNSKEPSEKYPSEAVAYESTLEQQLFKQKFNQQSQQQQKQAQSFKNPFNHFESQEDHSQPQQQRHSVLGIRNQFQDEDEEDEDNQTNQENEERDMRDNKFMKRPVGGGMSDAYLYAQQQQQGQKQQQNIFSSNKNANNAPNTNKVFQEQQKQQQQFQKNNKKQFSSSGESEEEQLNNNHNHLPKKYTTKLQPKQLQKQSQSEDDNQYFISPTIKKYKSADQKQKSKQLITSPQGVKKTAQKKNKNKFQSPSTKFLEVKSPKKLVAHPTVKKQLRKATNAEAKKLTSQVKSHVATTLKKKKQQKSKTQQFLVQSPVQQEMNRKRKQLKVKLTDYKQQKQLRNQLKQQSNTNQARTNMQLGKILNWRQGQLKKQKEEFQKGMEMKLQQQKQNYIRKINNLLIKLQKQKQLHEQQTYKQKLFKENQQAAKRLTAIEQWYKDRINMLKQKNSSSRNERTLMHTGHKEILKQIQKDLKRDNQKQIMAMTMKYRRQQAEIQNDLQELEREIIKVYKKN